MFRSRLENGFAKALFAASSPFTHFVGEDGKMFWDSSGFFSRFDVMITGGGGKMLLSTVCWGSYVTTNFRSASFAPLSRSHAWSCSSSIFNVILISMEKIKHETLNHPLAPTWHFHEWNFHHAKNNSSESDARGWDWRLVDGWIEMLSILMIFT